MPPGSPVLLALRPERLALAAQGQTEPQSLPARFLGSAYRGDALLCTLALPDGGTLRLTQPLGAGAVAPPSAGSEVRVLVPQSACILLAG
jgi:putrescine transport system ATP-binding protein